MQGRIGVRSLSSRVKVAIFGRILVGFDIRLKSVLRCSMTDAKMVVGKRMMAMRLISVIMFVRNIVLVTGLFVEREVSPGVRKNMRSDQLTFQLTLAGLRLIFRFCSFEVEYSVSVSRIAESSEELLFQQLLRWFS